MKMGNSMIDQLSAVLSQFWTLLIAFLPRILAALAILLAGLILAAALRGISGRVLRWIKFDQVLERAGAGAFLRKLSPTPPHTTVAKAVYWLTWIAVMLAALQALGVSGTDILVADFMRFLPRLAAAVLVLVVGFLLSGLAWRASLLAAVSAGMHAAKLLGSLARVLVVVATIAMALEQIDVGHGVMHTAFAIVFGGVMLAAAIAFGLGGRYAARRFLDETLLTRNKNVDRDGGPHM
jgi:hypothetical protein